MGPGAEPGDPLADAETSRREPVRPGVALADDDEPARAIGERRECLDRGRKPLAREAAADEEDRERAGGNGSLGPRGLTISGAVQRMKALEIDPVVHDRQTPGRHAVQGLDLPSSGVGDGDDVRRSREDAALERQDDPMIEATGAPPLLARQVRPVTSLAGAIHVLAKRALVTLDHVPAPARDREPGVHGQRHDARRRRQRRQRQGVKRHPAHRRLAARAEEVDVITVFDEGRYEARRRPLDPSVEDERPSNDEELHGSGGLEAGLDRGWPEKEAGGSDTPALPWGDNAAEGAAMTALTRNV